MGVIPAGSRVGDLRRGKVDNTSDLRFTTGCRSCLSYVFNIKI